MKVNSSRWIIGAMVIAILAPSSGANAYEDERFEISPMLGGLFGGDFEDYVPDYGYQTVKQGESALVGLRTTYFFTSNVGFEGTFAYSRSKFSLDESEGGFFDDNGGEELTDFNLYTLSGSVVFNFMSGQATPYFDMGGGINIYDMDESGMDSKARWQFQMGGGVRFYFNEFLGLRMDLRGFYTFMRDNDEDDEDYEYYDYDDDDNDDYEMLPSMEVSMGMIFIVP